MKAGDRCGNPLTEAESTVLHLVDRGLSNQEIAGCLSIAVGTVKSHLHRVYEKLQARNRLEAVARARDDGHIAPPAGLSAALSERNFR
jgi:LuxR family transcriptional regulator, maltose regulon positive regulatory protein